MAALPIDVGGPALYTTGLQIWLTPINIFSPLRLLGPRPRVVRIATILRPKISARPSQVVGEI